MIKIRRKLNITLITLMTVLSLLLTSAGGSLNAAVSGNRTDTQEVAAAKSALLAAGILQPIEGQDENVIPLVKAIIDEASSDVAVQVRISYNSQVDKSGNITYGSKAVNGNVTFKLTKGSAIVTEPVPVTVAASGANGQAIGSAPQESRTDAQEVAAAKAALLAAGTLQPIEGQDENMITVVQEIVDDASSGVSVQLRGSYNSGVDSWGNISYRSSVSGNVSFKLSKNRTSTTLTVPVKIRAASTTDSGELATAKKALQDVGALQPEEGQDTSVVPMAQAIIDKATSGVTVEAIASGNPQVSTAGVITYGNTAATGDVTFRLTRNNTDVTVNVPVTVPARLTTDSEEVASAKAALAAAGTLQPTKGQNTSVVIMAQAIADKASSGVTITMTNSGNPQVSSTGEVTYTSINANGDVTFQLIKNSVKDTISVPVTVAGQSSEINVRDFGAKGDGVTNDTAAINNAIIAAYNRGGGTVCVPDGTYMIDLGTSIKMKNNCSLNLDQNTILKAISTGENPVVKVSNARNVKISGGQISGGTGIRITGSDDVYIADINMIKCYYDGIYIGSNTTRNYCQGITIERVLVDGARRNGISVISVKDLIIRDSTFCNTRGALPQSGIDLEPNRPDEYMLNVLIENVLSYDNGTAGSSFGGWGLDFWLGGSTGGTYGVNKDNVSVIISNLTGYGNYRGNISSNVNKCISNGYDIVVQ